jgi:Family of unknown function (DUF6491)
MRFRPMVLAPAVALLIGGAGVSRASAGKTRKDCIYKREITTLRSLDDKHVYVKASSSHHYLMTMDGRCQGLSEARQLEVVEDSTRVCGQGTSMVAFRHPLAGPMRCHISTIETVKDLADAEEKAAQEVPASPAP